MHFTVPWSNKENYERNQSFVMCLRGSALTYGTMDRLIDPSWWTIELFSRYSLCSMTSITKGVVCDIQ